MKKILLTLSLILVASLGYSQQLAFPGAEGFGRYAIGGRNGTVYHVTNLNDTGKGSLRDAVSQPNRIVVFDVSGVIKIKDRMVFSSNLTIAGQTAPGDGIVVYGNGVTFSGAKDVICSHIRFRMGSGGKAGADGVGVANGKDMIFDHLSVSWGLDENFSINWDNKGSEPTNITIQNSIISQGLQTHSCGGLIQTKGGITLYRNLYIDNKTRNPKVKGLNQFVNNVVYNWGNGGGYILGGDSEGTSWATIEDNYFIKGPSTTIAPYSRANANFQLYASGNYYDSNLNGVLDGVESVKADYGPAFWVESPAYWETSTPKIPQPHPAIIDHMTAQEAYQWIVDNVGSSLPMRDAADDYVIDELLSLGTKGALISSQAELALPNTVGYIFNAPKLIDTDGDGIPDIYEELLGTDKNVDDAMVIGADGYANIERYIHAIKSQAPYLKYPFNIQAISRTKTEIGLSWKNLEDKASAVVVEISTDNANFSASKNFAGTATEGVIDNLQEGTTYYFRLKAVTDEMESLYSEVFSIKTDEDAALPLASTNPNPEIETILDNYKYITLSWSNISNVLGGNLSYDVYLGKDASDLLPVASDLVEKKYEIAELDENTTYYWRVDTKNLLGTTPGTVWSFTTAKAVVREMVLHLPFDEFSGNEAFDVIDDQIASAYDFSAEWVPGHFDNAIRFSGSPVTAHMKVPHTEALLLDNTPFTISLWFKSTGGTDIYLLHKGSHAKSDAGGTGKWLGIQYKASKLVFGVDDDVIKSTVEVTANTKFNNEWHHLACVRDLDNKKLLMYMDGEKFGEKADATLGIGEASDLIIANCNVNFNTPYKGDMDDLRIYNSALRADEIKALFLFNDEVGIGTQKNSAELKVFPNPFLDELRVSLPDVADLKNTTIKLTDLTGKVLAQQFYSQVENNELTLTGLGNIPSGIYILSVTSDTLYMTSKVIKK